MNDSSLSSTDTTLPRWAVRLLERLIPLHNRDVVLGDFAEVYHYIAVSEGRRQALRWYVGQVARSFPAFIMDGIQLGGAMFRNYLKVAWRNLAKRTFFSILNVGGLAIGMAACLLIFQYVAHELSYDDFHEHRDDLYRVTQYVYQDGTLERSSALTSYGLSEAMTGSVPGVANVARVHPNYGTATVAVTEDGVRRNAFREDDLYYADPSFFDLFSFLFLRGDPAMALVEPSTLILSEEAARRHFGDADPMGKTIDVKGWASGTYTVAGIMRALGPSHLKVDFLLPMHDLLQNDQYHDTGGWNWTNFLTYVRLDSRADRQQVAGTIDDVILAHDDRYAERGRTLQTVLQPIQDIHLYSDLDEDIGASGQARTVYFFTLVALFVLLIAWVNYINLSTARSMERAREVGIRKAAGARKGQVITQFLFESGLVNAVALVLAVVLATFALPLMNSLAGTEISGAVWANPWLWCSLVLLFSVGAVLASLYPAFVLSAFRPAIVLKGRPGPATSREALRKVLVVFQFAASIALLTGTYVVYEQVRYLRGVDLGMDIEQVFVVERPSFVTLDSTYAANREVFKQELARIPSVRSVTTSTSVPGEGFSYGGPIRRKGADPSESEEVNASWVHYTFLDTYGLHLVAGRNFSEDHPSDLENGLLINETAVRALGFASSEEAVGETVVIGGGTSEFVVVGVLEDFHWLSAKQVAGPVGLGLTRGGSNYSIKVHTADMAQTIEAVHAVYDRIFPNNPFHYAFADRLFDEQYQADRRFGLLFGLFAAFSLVVACLGLIGLAAHAVSQRTKEIGIRKVLGASVPGLARLLLTDVVKLVVVAMVIAAPLMYWAANVWLADFATRMDLGVELFLWPGLLVLGLALLAVSYHTLRIVHADPVKALRYE